MSDDATGAAPRRRPILELDDVHAGYVQFKALFGVSLAVHEAEAVALIGPNGAGKTTVARVASGLVAPTAGRVLVDGEDFTGAPADELRPAGIAHAPEGRSVFATLTVEENLTLAFRRRFGRAGVAAALEKAYELFPRLGERRRQSAGSLSGGEQRMLTLAARAGARAEAADRRRAVARPGADHHRRGLLVLERILASGTALLVVEQHVDHALELADEVVVLERGVVPPPRPPEPRRHPHRRSSARGEVAS